METQRRPNDPDAIRTMVQEGYTRVAQRSEQGAPEHAEDLGRKIGYSNEELRAVPEGANLGLGCGNPTAIDALRPGEVVVDLGSGAGMDAFLAAAQVGGDGRVIGIDMTDAMLEKARANASKAGWTNVEFRKGRIEELPLDDASVDVIISNCVINLSPQKDRVYREAYRVLRPGGRLMVSDLVLERELPAEIIESVEAYLGCIGGASLRSRYLATIEEAGFGDVQIDRETSFASAISLDDPQVREAMERFDITLDEVEDFLGAVTSLQIRATK